MKRSQPNATRLDEDWRPSEDNFRKYQTTYPNLDIDAEFIKFQEYYINLTTNKAYKINWNLTFNRWLINGNKWAKEELAHKTTTKQYGNDQRQALNIAFNAIPND